MTTHPHFCVALPTYNRAHTLPRAIDSVLAQTYPHFELLILDDGSTDSTVELMKGYNDSRIRYLRFPENRGAVAMDEMGLAHACMTADVWTHLGSDDWWEKRKLEADVGALGGGIEAVYGPAAIVDGANRVDYPNAHVEDPRDMILGQGVFACTWANIAISTVVLRKVMALHGRFCHPRLRHVSDIVISSRIIRFCDIKFRTGLESFGIWTQGGASSTRAAEVAAECSIAWQIVRDETARWGTRHAA